MKTAEDGICKRDTGIAVLLSLVAPGFGQIYCGRIIRALLFMLALQIPVLLFAFNLPGQTTLTAEFALVYGLCGIISVVAIIDAFFCARKIRNDYKLKDYNKWYTYVLLLLIGIPSVATTAMLFRAERSVALRMVNNSMAPNIQAGDRILVSKTAFDSKLPHRGDVIIYAMPENRKLNLTSRVLAIADDRVEIQGNKITINSKELTQSLIPGNSSQRIAVETNGQKVYKVQQPSSEFRFWQTVPKDYVLLYKDNRSESDTKPQLVPVMAIKGKVQNVYWPPKDWVQFGSN